MFYCIDRISFSNPFIRFLIFITNPFFMAKYSFPMAYKRNFGVTAICHPVLAAGHHYNGAYCTNQ